MKTRFIQVPRVVSAVFFLCLLIASALGASTPSASAHTSPPTRSYHSVQPMNYELVPPVV